MSDEPENPAAFPQHPGIQIDGPLTDYYGMTLRDWFAGQALAGIGTWMPAHCENLTSNNAKKSRAQWAYAQADAMLAERRR